MRSPYLLLLFVPPLVLTLIFEASAQTTIKKNVKSVAMGTTKKIKRARSATRTTVFNEFAPDNELGTECYDACYPNSTYLDAAGKIKDPGKYGLFTDEFCGKTYLFGNKSVTWAENWKICCSIGMSPVIFDTFDEYKCLQNTASDRKLKFLEGRDLWAGGFRHGLNNFWYWCTKDSPENIERDFYSELKEDSTENPTKGSAKNKPKSQYGDHNCLYMQFSEVSSVFSNSLCDEKKLLSCESVEKYPKNLLPDTKCKAKCETQNCAVNKTLFKPNKKQEQHLKDRYTYGRWVSRCGRYFLFSNRTATYNEARKRCCSYGTSLLSIKTAAKRGCLTRVVKEYQDTAGDYWTSGTDVGCDGNYRWCSVDRAFLKKEVKWAKKEPKKSNGDCVWLRATDNAQSTAIFTGNCEKKRKFICEVRQSGTTVEAVQRECIQLLGLTKKEVGGLKNTTKYTYKMKCYLRCIGDNLGMIINGTLQEGNVMRLMEKSNEKSDMDQGYDAIEECKNEEDPNDNCESAYKMYKCGNEKAPVVFGKMVFWEEATSEKKNSPVEITIPRQCPSLGFSEYNFDSKSLSLFKSSGITIEGGSSITGWNNKIWYKSQFNESHNYNYATSYCAFLQMSLPLAENFEDFVKLYDFMNGSTSDNFYMATQSSNMEVWCEGHMSPVPAEASADNFRLLPEISILVSKKGSEKYKLIPVLKSQLGTIVAVNHFFCEPPPTDE